MFGEPQERVAGIIAGVKQINIEKYDCQDECRECRPSADDGKVKHHENNNPRPTKGASEEKYCNQKEWTAMSCVRKGSTVQAQRVRRASEQSRVCQRGGSETVTAEEAPAPGSDDKEGPGRLAC